MKITLINGSMAKKSHTLALLRFIELLLQEKDAETTLWDLREKPLINVMPEYHRDPSQTPDARVKEWVQMIKESDGVILGSPLYHGSFSGVLKNALDNLGPHAFKHKPIGLVGNASGLRAAMQAPEELRTVVRGLGGYAVPIPVGTAGSDYELIPEGYILTNDEVKERVKLMVEDMLLFIHLYQNHTKN